MGAQLSSEDRDLIRELRAAGVLRDIDNYRVDQTQGAILVTCSDGDQFCDIFTNQVHMQAGCRSDPRIHVFGWHGGALACAPCSPINRQKHADVVFLDQIADARVLKEIDVVVLYAHAPCGAAALHGVGLTQAFALQIRAKIEIKTLNEGINVVCCFHVDHGNDKKRSYFLSRPDWERWAEQRGIQAIA